MNIETGIRTICALTTPVGHGGIAVVRLSGPESEVVIRKLCPFLPSELESHRVYYGKIKNQKGDEVLDEVLVTYFEKGRSFTGEMTFEISAHGGSFVVEDIQQHLTRAGALMAEPGEFTFQAFLNNRIDLVQAESILSLIESQSRLSKKISLNQLEGKLSGTYLEIEGTLTWALAHMEANIDFSEENLEIVGNQELTTRLGALKIKVDELIQSYDQGRMIRQGLQVALIGAPNVGKSSLFNSLVEMDRSIVSPQAGTTRDWVSEQRRIDGISFEFIDTAGLRESTDQVESIGIERTKKRIQDAAAVLWVIDSSRPMNEEDFQASRHIQNQNVIVVLNKSDLKDPKLNLDLPQGITVSAKTGEGIEKLRAKVASLFKVAISESQAVVLQARQFEDLLQIQKGIEESLFEVTKPGFSPEFAVLGLRHALNHALRIRGKQFDDEVIDRVFKEFCLGK